LRESPVFGLARVIRGAGYVPANSAGARHPIYYYENIIGILRSNKWGRFRKIFFIYGSMDYIGEIHLNGSDWDLNVYGRAHVSELTNLAEKITKKMNVKMKVKLVSQFMPYEYGGDP
ncbi:MAG TPA: hypothetical protein VJK03_00405, partial [Candidatus Nanoarchaeia archaeon]|nr:hypothetical protein [Candidatus Nanoarchaeia archaeon]